MLTRRVMDERTARPSEIGPMSTVGGSGQSAQWLTAIPSFTNSATVSACPAPALHPALQRSPQGPVPDEPGTFSGRVTRVVDGDTFRLGSRDLSIRVWGLDAPERGRPGGSEATATLTLMIDGEQLTCRERDVDRYGRIVGQCFTDDGRDIAAAMIGRGVATEYCRYSDGAYGTC